MKSVFTEPRFEKLLVKLEDVIYTSGTGEGEGNQETGQGPEP